MTIHARWLTIPTILSLPILTALGYGGWSVVTVSDLPDHFVAGQPVTLKYTVRQHGVELLRGLKGGVEAQAGRHRVTGTVAPGRSSGEYIATLHIPEPGAWTVTLHAGFGRDKATLAPIPAVAAGAPAPATPPLAERGRRLFTAKGCVTCHVEMDVAPRLAGKRYESEWLARLLADPDATVGQRRTDMRMPNLGLSRGEIEALVSYVNSGSVAAR